MKKKKRTDRNNQLRKKMTDMNNQLELLN